jgi:diaminopropionate ammonia-lyase
VLQNPHRHEVALTPPSRETLDFHRRLPGYAPTMLVDAPLLADSLGVGRVLVKAETQRLGLPAFKILGASWATYRALVDHLGHDPGPWSTVHELALLLNPLKPFTLATATDGNHGRAVAFMARLLGFEAHVFVPTGTAPARIEAIRGEGANVTIVDGDYDQAVQRAALEAGERCLVVSDTSWPGYEVTPRRVAEGYATIFHEIDDTLAASDASAPDLVVIPVGVGALMAAAVTHYRSAGTDAGADVGARPTPVLVGVEPADANCVQASVRAGRIVSTPGPHHSIMVGLNCGTPSLVAWPMLEAGVDCYVSMDDSWAAQAMRDLAEAGVVSGETGAAALGGLEALLSSQDAAEHRLALGLHDDATVLLLCTEGATDPATYERLVGRRPDAAGAIMRVSR